MRKAMIFGRCAAAALLVWVAAIAVIEGGGSGCGPFPQLSGSYAQLTGSYELNEDGTGLRFVITGSGLSGPVTAAHFHNANAVATMPGPVVLDLAPFLTQVHGQIAVAGNSSFSEWSIDNVLEEIRAGRVYIELHSAAYPDGEISGPVQLY